MRNFVRKTSSQLLRRNPLGVNFVYCSPKWLFRAQKKSLYTSVVLFTQRRPVRPFQTIYHLPLNLPYFVSWRLDLCNYIFPIAFYRKSMTFHNINKR
ncbi:hypothetical protein FKM82_018592 [Ascaphus truei]